MTASAEHLLYATRSFWNANPCDGHTQFDGRMKYRYAKEPWLPAILERVARHASVLEVGCGQGTDALYCCQHMDPAARYLGVDLSESSVASARQSLDECRSRLRVIPEFRVENAEALEIADNAFECVISTGVLHHTPNTQKAIDEVRRVLQPGGLAMISLYRLWSPKIFGAHAIRLASRGLDSLIGRDRYLYTQCSRLGSNHALGTLLLECLGVPILRSYTRRQLRPVFAGFEDVSIRPIGLGMPTGPFRRLDRGYSPLGALWLVEARKPREQS